MIAILDPPESEFRSSFDTPVPLLYNNSANISDPRAALFIIGKTADDEYRIQRPKKTTEKLVKYLIKYTFCTKPNPNTLQFGQSLKKMFQKLEISENICYNRIC